MSKHITVTKTFWRLVGLHLQSQWALIGMSLFLILLAAPICTADTNAHSPKRQHAHNHITTPGQWEGSSEGIAYSELNHALAGLGVILMGLTELRTALGWTAWAWSQWLLPVALVASGIFLLIWSDHEAWPIGSLTLPETLSGHDPEMLQHKIFGILALGVGVVEWFRRVGKLGPWFWSTLLPGFALIGGSMLFLHMHGPHPAAHQIQSHHHVMGSLALVGGLAWFSGEWIPSSVQLMPSRRDKKSRPLLKIIWSLSVIIIGAQLLFYSES